MKPILSFLPGPILAWVNAWLGIFTHTFLYPYDQSGHPDATAAALATVSVGVGYLAYSRATIKIQLISAIAFGLLALLCVGGIFYAKESLRFQMPEGRELFLQSLSYYCYLAMIVGFCTMLMLFAKYATIRSK
jgi:hypothetical protein